MALLPNWTETAPPHDDIIAGTFDDALFAADLGRVSKGEGPRDYLDAELFARKTYLTENLRAALTEIGNRLAGEPDAKAVHRMQTEFGGGKTHTLLAAYHLFGNARAVRRTPLAKQLAGLLKGGALPHATVVVLDGSDLTPDRNEKANRSPGRTLLGHLAYQLGGDTAYESVRESDEAYAATSVSQLVGLLQPHTPCLILMDETLEYLAKTFDADSKNGMRTTTSLVLIKELTSAITQVPGACLVATLTASHLEDFAEVNHEDLLERLMKIFGRTENVVTPVEGDDIFPVLHTRLFRNNGTPSQRRAVADAYGAYYVDQFGDALPAEFRDPTYRDRIEAAYPFHPELIDVLTNRWGSLSGFQRTRGALRTLAHTVKALHRASPQSALIHPGDLPLHDAGVRAEVLKIAGESYKSALNADIIRDDSRSRLEDKRRGGEVERASLATGLASTAFIHSFSSDKVLGASDAQMILGVGRPGISRGTLEDVRDTIKNAAWYMRYEGGRYRFTTEPNLNKVIVERESAVAEPVISQLLEDATATVAPTAPPWRTQPGVLTSADVRDEPRLCLALLHPDHRVEASDPVSLAPVAAKILNEFDQSGRTNKNSVVVVAPDAGAFGRARTLARTLAAMRDLQSDGPRIRKFNKEQQNDLRQRIALAEQRVPALLVMAYRYVYLLANGIDGGAPTVAHLDLGAARASETITSRVTERLRSTDGLLDKLAPAALLSHRFGLMLDDVDAVEIEGVLKAFQRFPRLPKLASNDVLRDCLVEGVRREVFGLISGSHWNDPDAVVRIGDDIQPDEIDFQPGTWLTRATMARDRRSSRGPAEPATVAPPSLVPDRPQPHTNAPGPPRSVKATGRTQLRLRIADIPADKLREAVKVAALQFAAQGAEVLVSMEVSVSSSKPIPAHIVDLVVEEGLGQLGLQADITD
ncbi:ATP-binding protein [Nocardia sp. NPDC003999]